MGKIQEEDLKYEINRRLKRNFEKIKKMSYYQRGIRLHECIEGMKEIDKGRNVKELSFPEKEQWMALYSETMIIELINIGEGMAVMMPPVVFKHEN